MSGHYDRLSVPQKIAIIAQNVDRSHTWNVNQSGLIIQFMTLTCCLCSLCTVSAERS